MGPKVEAAKNMLCMACLCVERTLRELSEGKYKQYYLDSVNEIPLFVMPRVLSICWECEAMLKKAVDFREQVKDSYRILQTYTSENLVDCLLTDVPRPPRLKPYVISSINILPGLEVTEEPKEKERGSECIKIEPKSENLEEEIIISLEHRDHLCDTDSLDEERCQSVKAERIVSHVPSKDPAPEDQNTLEEKTEELQVVDVKRRGEMEFEKNDSEVNDSDRDSFLSDFLDLNLDTEVQEFVATKKAKKRTKGDMQTVKRGKKMVKKVRKPDKVRPRIKTNKISTIKISYEEMVSERLKESSKESYKNSPYKCESCIMGYNTGKTYNAHMETKHSPDIGKHTCPICNIKISTMVSFTEHCKRHFRRFECTICKKRTLDKKTLEQHIFSSHEIALREYRCDLCGKISNSIDSHRYHKDTHKSRIQCPDCEKTFSHRAGLTNHRLAVHELRNTFPCTVCEKVFKWRTSLRRHLDKHQLKSKGVINSSGAFCATCNIEFSSHCSYRRHLRNSLKHVTRDQLKFICDHCNKRFADKTKIRDHIEEKHLHKVYQCQICNKETKNRVGLDQHIRYVHRGRPNSKMCHYCGKGFPTKVQLESHIRSHTGERPFICEYCPTTFSQKSNLYKHNRQVHLNIKSKRHPLCKKRKEERKPTDITVHQPNQDKQPEWHSGSADRSENLNKFECTICKKRTLDKKTLEQHIFSSHEIALREYRCDLCGKISNSIDSHRYHKDTHKSRIQCPDCEKTFSHRAGLTNHRLAVHELRNTFPCTVCEKVFKWRTSLRRHLDKHQLKSKGVINSSGAFCATCNIEFSSHCSYRRHLRNSLKHVTRDQLKFICDHCNKRFADKTKIRDHIEEKHLHKVYQCQICNKETKNRVGLDQHIRYVHRGRPNSKMCHYCGKGFPTKVQLESHIRSHTGERPFICEYCPTTFSQKSNLYKHNRQVHLNIKSKRHPLCKKRKEERKPTDITVHQPNQDKQPEVRTSNFPEQFSAKLRTPEFIVGW